jgi:hypothetical protein
MRCRPLLCGVLAAAAVLACDSGNPVVPSAPPQPAPGSQAFTLELSSQPPELQAGSAEPATVTVTAKGAADRMAPPDGTQVTLSTDSGSLGVGAASAPVQVVTLSLTGGAARVSFFPGAEVGKATLLAELGGSIGRLEIPVVEALPRNFFLTSVSPTFGSPDGGQAVAITGAGFESPLRVLIGGVVAQVLSVAPGTVQAVTPPAAVPVAAGQVVPVDVTVVNALNQPDSATDTLPGAFAYTREATPPLFLRSVDPAVGAAAGGTRVAVLGGGFVAPVQVAFGGQQGDDVRVVSSSRITVLTPPAAQEVPAGQFLAVDVAVTSDLSGTPRQASLPGGFRYDGGEPPPPPEMIVVSAISPAEGPFGGGTSVEITGSGFRYPVAIELGGIRQSSEAFVNDTMVRFATDPVSVAECPADGRVPRVGVKVTNLASGVSGSADLTFTYLVPRPTISRITPTAGSQLGNTQVTIEGSDFEEPVRVLFGRPGEEFAATVLSVAADRVRASSPRLPDTFFPETDCVTSDSEPGKRYQDVAVDVTVVHQGTGCTDTLPQAFIYRPSNPGCRVVSGGG